MRDIKETYTDKHSRRKHGECGGDKRPHDSVCRESRRGVHQIHVYQITLHSRMSDIRAVRYTNTHQERHEHQVDTHSNENSCTSRCSPMHTRIFASPSKPEASDNQAGTANHCPIQPLLRRRETFPFWHKHWVFPLTSIVDDRS